MAIRVKSEKKQRYIPMEVTKETIVDYGITRAKLTGWKIGNKWKQVILVPATEEQYLAYMRPLWRQDKQEQRTEQPISLDKQYEETEYELPDPADLEADVVKRELHTVLLKIVSSMDKKNRTIVVLFSRGFTEVEIGKTIGMSQKGVNKRKKKIFLTLKTKLKGFR
jgi:hypothetical protein